MKECLLIDVNPYTPPSETEAPDDDPIVAAKARLARPATALIIMASTHAVFPSIILVSAIFSFIYTSASFAVMLMLFIALCQSVVLVFIAVGAAKMGFLESFKLGRMAAILACIPVVSPFVVVGIPFGMWSLRLLSEPAIQQAFQLNATRIRKAQNPYESL